MEVIYWMGKFSGFAGIWQGRAKGVLFVLEKLTGMPITLKSQTSFIMFVSNPEPMNLFRILPVLALLLFSCHNIAGQTYDTLLIPEMGGKYIGQINSGKQPHGYGTFTWTYGGSYAGNWKNGVFHGSGKRIWHTGDSYEGTWKNGQRHGNGVMTWSSNMTYNGKWKFDQEHGKGIITYPGGTKRAGKWKHSQMHGTGYLINPDGTKTKRKWHYGCLLKNT